MSRSATAGQLAIDEGELPSATDLLNYLPEIYEISWEDYVLGFDDVPPDFVKTQPATKLVTYEEILKRIDPKVTKRRSHVMITGGAGRGKTTVGRKATDEVVDKRVHMVQQQHMAFFFDMRYYEGNDIVSIPEFIFRRKCEEEPPALINFMYTAVATNPSKMLFIFQALDQLPYDFESNCEVIDLTARATVRVILHNILAGHLFRESKILTTVRDHRVKNFTGNLRPDYLFQVGDLTEDVSLELAKGALGYKTFQRIIEVWQKRSVQTCLLNRNPQILMENVISGAMSEPHKFATTMPMAMLHLVLAAAYRQLYVSPIKDKKPPVLPVINKMKQVAYYAVQEGKPALNVIDVERMFHLTLEEIDSACVCHGGRIDSRFSILEVRDYGVIQFCDHFARDFLCSLRVTELPMVEYKDFISDFIHQPRYHLIRRMVCGLILDPNVRKCAKNERIMRVTDDLRLRQDVLLTSMREEFHKVKRRDLLEFFHAVHDGGKGAAKIVPREVDVIDLSHIQLFIHDMQALGASLSGGIKIGYLNLEACGFTSEGVKLFDEHLHPKHAKEITKITRLNINWCPEWHEYMRGVHGMANVVKTCEVRDLSMSNCQVAQECLFSFGSYLDDYTLLQTLRLQHHALEKDEGFNVLGDFIIRHGVENLHILAENMTEQQKEELVSGWKELKKECSVNLQDKTTAIGRIFVVDRREPQEE